VNVVTVDLLAGVGRDSIPQTPFDERPSGAEATQFRWLGQAAPQNEAPLKFEIGVIEWQVSG
jgi:hypothetical protein